MSFSVRVRLNTSAALSVTAPGPVCNSALGLKLALGEARAITAADAAAMCVGGLAAVSEYVFSDGQLPAETRNFLV